MPRGNGDRWSSLSPRDTFFPATRRRTQRRPCANGYRAPSADAHKEGTVRTPPRRVVTGHDEQGRSVVVLDTGPGNVFINEALAVKSYEMWATDESPVSIVRVPADPMGRPITIPPMPHGTVIRVADFEPDPSLRGETEVAAAATQAFAQLDPTASQWEPGAHPGLHRTETVD